MTNPSLLNGDVRHDVRGEPARSNPRASMVTKLDAHAHALGLTLRLTMTSG